MRAVCHVCGWGTGEGSRGGMRGEQGRRVDSKVKGQEVGVDKTRHGYKALRVCTRIKKGSSPSQISSSLGADRSTTKKKSPSLFVCLTCWGWSGGKWLMRGLKSTPKALGIKTTAFSVSPLLVGHVLSPLNWCRRDHVLCESQMANLTGSLNPFEFSYFNSEQRRSTRPDA